MATYAIWLFLSGAAVLCCIGVSYAIASTRISASPTKGKRQFAAFVYIGFGICLLSLALIISEGTVHLAEVDGSIASTETHAKGKDYETTFALRLPSGTMQQFTADGESTYFRVGQHLHVAYELSARPVRNVRTIRFLSPTGAEEGRFNSLRPWVGYAPLLLGLYWVWVGFRRYKRDPEGSVQGSHRNPKPYGDVDQSSLMHLSTRLRKRRK